MHNESKTLCSYISIVTMLLISMNDICKIIMKSILKQKRTINNINKIIGLSMH